MEDFVILFVSDKFHEVTFYQGILEEAGIESFVLDQYVSQLYGTVLTSGIRLQVKAEDEERARKILAPFLG